MHEIRRARGTAPLPVRRRQNTASRIHESPTRRFQLHVGLGEHGGTLIEAQTRHAERICLRKNSSVNGLGKLRHIIRTRDLHRCHSPLKGSQGRVGRVPQFAVVFVPAPVRLDAGDDDRVEGCVYLTTAIKNRGEGDASFVAEAMADVDGLLIENLLAASSRLNERPSKGPSERSRDSKPGRPNGGVPLIHAAHHAWREAADADA